MKRLPGRAIVRRPSGAPIWLASAILSLAAPALCLAADPMSQLTSKWRATALDFDIHDAYQACRSALVAHVGQSNINDDDVFACSDATLRRCIPTKGNIKGLSAWECIDTQAPGIASTAKGAVATVSYASENESSAHGLSLNHAKAGLEALNRGDNYSAISSFTSAILIGGLSPSDLELAHVKRAEAYLADANPVGARIDIDDALKIDPNDQEALDVRSRLAIAQAAPPPQPTPVAEASQEATVQDQQPAPAVSDGCKMALAQAAGGALGALIGLATHTAIAAPVPVDASACQQ